MALTKAKPRKVAVRDAGGDNEVERDGNGRPRILVQCVKCDATGKIPSPKTGRPIKCQKCKGEGEHKESYTRVTTFIDVLEDKETLMTWVCRMVLLGVAMDPGFLHGVLDDDPEVKEHKDMLNRRAEAAKEMAGASRKADQGTLLHGLSELADVGEELPDDIEPQDWLDIESYVEVTSPLLDIYLMEQLVVNDEYKVAGTPDRVSTVKEGVLLVSPCRRHGDECKTGIEVDGEFRYCLGRHVFRHGELIITDLKTGRIDYGALKMAMQLSIYSNSKLYNKETGERIEIPDVNREWGLIMHTAAGSGVTTLYWADLLMGWEAVALAKEVRGARSQGKKALVALDREQEIRVNSVPANV